MIWTEKYRNYQIQDLGILFKRVNNCFYTNITEMGFDLDLSNKDQQKIYFHFLVKNLCSEIMKDTTYPNLKLIFYINLWDICEIHKKMIKKLVKIFGIKIFENHYSLEEFIGRLETNECDMVEKFETFLNQETKPKSFKQIKKFLEKEGFTDLVDNYFSDITNKMAIMG
jgi:hypothetical protein